MGWTIVSVGVIGEVSLPVSFFFYNRHTGFSITGVYFPAIGLFVNPFSFEGLFLLEPLQLPLLVSCPLSPLGSLYWATSIN